MAIVIADWSVDRATGNVRYIGTDHGVGSPSYATVIEFHRFLQDLADDASSVGDDEVDITDENPTARSTDNIITMLGSYNIDNVAAEHLYDGSVIQNSGADIYDGIVNFGNSDVQIQIIQNGAILADDWWNFSGAGLNADATQGISHRFMLKTRTAGTDIDGRKLVGTSRTFGKTFSEFVINSTSRGNNVLALSDATDLNNQTLEATIATYNDIVNATEGYALLDINNDTTDEHYYSEWDLGTRTINDLYERAKWLTRASSVSTLYGLNGEIFRGITHEIVVDTPTGTFNAFEPISWAGGTGQMLAINSTTAGTKLWMQLLTGSAPIDNDVLTGGTSGATVTVNVTITSKTIANPFVGVSTGSSLIGAYGIGMQVTDVSATDSFTDLDGLAVTPPNNVSFSVGGVVIGEDRVLVAPWDGATTDSEGNPAITKNQLALNTTLSGVAETAIVVTAAIPSDTPSTGFVRVGLDDGSYRSVAYTSWAASTFTIAATDFSTTNATAANNVWIAYIDKLATATTESFTSIYLADRSLVVIVRDGGGSPIKQFITSATLTSSGGSVTAIRTSDL